LYAADTAKPYLGRALHDEEFRDNLRAAFAAARAIYDELSRQRGVSGIAATAATDEEIHANLRRSIKELQQAADRLQGRRAEKSHTLRNVMLVFAGIAIGVFFNPFTGPAARRWVTGKGGSPDGYSPNGNT
jgi:predicted phosphoribosyltransferase